MKFNKFDTDLALIKIAKESINLLNSLQIKPQGHVGEVHDFSVLDTGIPIVRNFK